MPGVCLEQTARSGPFLLSSSSDRLLEEQAYSAGADSVMKTFPESNCKKECLVAQLEQFYKKLDCRPKNEAGTDEGDGSEAPSSGNKQLFG